MPVLEKLVEVATDAGRARLLEWQRAGVQLGFVYSRSLGGLVQTGQCRIASLTGEVATLETAGGKMIVVVKGAKLEAGPQIFFTPDLTGNYQVEGVALQLENHDWLFFSERAIPGDVILGGAG